MESPSGITGALPSRGEIVSWSPKEETTISERRKCGDEKESSVLRISSEKEQRESISI